MHFKDCCVEIRNVIVKDFVALEKWNTVKDSLCNNPVDLLKISRMYKDKEYDEAILLSIQLWSSTQVNPTWEQFTNIMNNNGLSKLAGDLERMKENIYIKWNTIPQNLEGHKPGWNVALLKHVSAGIVATAVVILVIVSFLYSDLILESLNWHNGRPKGIVDFELSTIPHNFVGRQTDMEQLHDLMLKSRHKDPGFGQYVAVTGLGGIGKSTLCTKYAYDNRRMYQNVIWINAETTDSIRSSFQRLATKLGIPTSHDLEALMEAVHGYFRDKTSLFIFDNVEQLAVLNPFRPKVNTWSVLPFILITSRTLDILPVSLHLNTWTKDEATRFVLSEVNSSIQSDAEELVKLLECLPLALQQAVAYIRERFGEFGEQTPIQKYIAMFKTNAANLLNDGHFRNLNGYAKTTYSTWSVTLDHIKGISKTAVNVLEILSLLNPDQISIKFTSSLMKEDLEQSLMVLKKYSIISLQFGMVRIHRLVQQVVMLGLGEGRRTLIISGVLKVIQDTFNGSNLTNIVKESVSHGFHISKNLRINQLSASYLSQLCWYLDTYGDSADSLELSSRAVQHFTSDLEPNHFSTLIIMYRMGHTHYISGEKSEALAIFENIQQLAIANSKIGNEHRLAFLVKEGIARVYLTTDPENSLKMYEELIPIMERLLGRSDKHVLIAVKNKAMAMLILGILNEEEALTAFERLHKMEVPAGADENVNGLITKFYIANLLFNQGEINHAIRVMNEVFQGRLSLLGDAHPDTIEAQSMLTIVENARFILVTFHILVVIVIVIIVKRKNWGSSTNDVNRVG